MKKPREERAKSQMRKRPEPAHDSVVEYLRSSIVKGELLPGQKVPQDEIAERLRVSRMPVRQALARLDAEGFVRLLPNRGAVIRELSIDDIREVYQIRIELEGLAVRLAVPRRTEDQLKRLRGLIAKMRHAARREAILPLLELNKQFHVACYQTAGNVRLIGLIEALRNYSLRYRVFHAHIPHRLRESLREHEAILEAFEMGNPRLAEARTEHNMRRTADLLIERLERHWAATALVASVPPWRQSGSDGRSGAPNHR